MEAVAPDAVEALAEHKIAPAVDSSAAALPLDGVALAEWAAAPDVQAGAVAIVLPSYAVRGFARSLWQ